MIDGTMVRAVYPGDDRALLSFDLPADEILRRLGPSHLQMDETDGEPGPCEYWSYRFPCGLTTLIVHHFQAPGDYGLTVYADAPEIQHILHHVPLADCVSWRLDREVSSFYEDWYGSATRFSVVRVEDDGREIVLSSHPTRRAADCIREAMEEFSPVQNFRTRENLGSLVAGPLLHA